MNRKRLDTVQWTLECIKYFRSEGNLEAANNIEHDLMRALAGDERFYESLEKSYDDHCS